MAATAVVYTGITGVALLMLFVVDRSHSCTVHVKGVPFPPEVMVPRNCTELLIDCNRTGNPFWAVHLPGVATHYQFHTREKQLNDRGVYNVSGPPNTLRLLIKDMELNDQTVVYCNGITREEHRTRIMIYEPTTYVLEVSNLGLKFVNISWQPDIAAQEHMSALSRTENTPQTFDVLISHGPQTSHVVSISNQHYMIFTAPDDAPPCEVYNFSVTATPVGATTYTGGGCSMPSAVLNITLPSLPDVSYLEQSLNCQLIKESVGWTIKLYFEAAVSCDGYPVENYTLVIGIHSSEVPMQFSVFPLIENALSIDELSENVVYEITVIAAAGFGNVSTYPRKLYITDVQAVTVTEVLNATTSTTSLLVQCTFIENSSAKGCLVVLRSKNGTLTVNLARKNTTTSQETVSINRSLSCYRDVSAYDIESDGSIGVLPIPVEIRKSSRTCRDLPQESVQSFTGGVISSVTAVMLILVIVTSVTIVSAIMYKRTSRLKKSHNQEHHRPMPHTADEKPV